MIPVVKSLRQRLILFLLVPVALLLVGMGGAVFLYARGSLLHQWREATILKLQRAAHQVDMRLSGPKRWVAVFQRIMAGPDGDRLQEAMLDLIRQTEGIADARILDLQRPGGEKTGGRMESCCDLGLDGKGCDGCILPPRRDADGDSNEVVISAVLEGPHDHPVRMELEVHFDYLVDAVVAAGWWQRYRAYLIDQQGRVLTSSAGDTRGRRVPGSFGEGGRLEADVLKAMAREPFGTVMEAGHPPRRVAGFYRLHEAPWFLVVIAPGAEVLADLVKFQLFVILIGSGFILTILLLIHWVTGRTVESIRKVSHAAGLIAAGEIGAPLPVPGADEVGELTRSFNNMMQQLKERRQMKQALNLAMEVQQNLLPESAPFCHRFDIAGHSVYCDETGGDYYDFFKIPPVEGAPGGVGIAVGDVSGHGISAALLMTTVRALLRGQVAHAASPADVVTRVNRHLCGDTERTGNFMSLFFAKIYPESGELRWVRAGHDPAIVYHPATDRFSELDGEGVVLGMDVRWRYKESHLAAMDRSAVVLIATDGAWESTSAAGEMFGKERLRRLLKAHHGETARVIAEKMLSAVQAFTAGVPQTDDITLVVMKAR